jgi:hypothetical protein
MLSWNVSCTKSIPIHQSFWDYLAYFLEKGGQKWVGRSGGAEVGGQKWLVAAFP